MSKYRLLKKNMQLHLSTRDRPLEQNIYAKLGCDSRQRFARVNTGSAPWHHILPIHVKVCELLAGIDSHVSTPAALRGTTFCQFTEKYVNFWAAAIAGPNIFWGGGGRRAGHASW